MTVVPRLSDVLEIEDEIEIRLLELKITLQKHVLLFRLHRLLL